MIEVISKKSDILTMKAPNGKVVMCTACAQIQMKDEAGDGYLTLCWTLEPGDSFAFYITDEPIYEYMLRTDLTDEEMEEFDIRCFEGDEYTIRNEKDYDGPYGAQLKELLNLLTETMKKHGLKMKTVKKVPEKSSFVKNTEKMAGGKANFSKTAGKTEKKANFSKTAGKTEKKVNFPKTAGKTEKKVNFSKTAGKTEKKAGFFKTSGKSETKSGFKKK